MPTVMPKKPAIFSWMPILWALVSSLIRESAPPVVAWHRQNACRTGLWCVSRHPSDLLEWS